MTALKETVVIGAGAIGSFLAARLHKSGHKVSLLARGRRLAAIESDGVRIATPAGTTTVAVPVCGWSQMVCCPQVAIICTKSCHLPEVLDRLAGLTGAPRNVLTLQNGVEAPDEVCASLPSATVLAGRVHGFFELDEQVVRHVGVDPNVLIGLIRGGDDVALSSIADLLSNAGVACAGVRDIRVELWRKFMLAASLGGVACYSRIAAGRVLSDAVASAMFRSALGEVARLAKSLDIDLPRHSVEETLSFAAEFPPEATTSLQRDIMHGKPNEYDALVGAVIRLAGQARVPIPTFTEINRRLIAERFNQKRCK